MALVTSAGERGHATLINMVSTMPEKQDHSAWKTIDKTDCPHLNILNTAMSSAKRACEVCGLNESLRICLTCGFVGCCESYGAHDTEHSRAKQHPFIRPHLCDYNWLWCYACNAFLEG